MDSKEIIAFIQKAKKKTPVKAYLNLTKPLDFPPSLTAFGTVESPIVFGDYEDLEPFLKENVAAITALQIESDGRNSAVPLLDTKSVNARIEPGAIIRDLVEIGERAVIMMGAVVNIGAIIGTETMIDMGAVLGGRAVIGRNCHIGANAVIAGVIEPPSAQPTVIGDNVLVGAGAVVLEGVQVGAGAIVAAGAVVTENVPENTVVGGIPARVLKMKDEKTESKTQLLEALREL